METEIQQIRAQIILINGTIQTLVSQMATLSAQIAATAGQTTRSMKFNDSSNSEYIPL